MSLPGSYDRTATGLGLRSRFSRQAGALTVTADANALSSDKVKWNQKTATH